MAPGILVPEPFTGAPVKDIQSQKLAQAAPAAAPATTPAAASKLIREPLKLTGVLDGYKSFDLTPHVGTEFPEANVVEWLRAPNSDELIRELGVTISRRGVCVFRAQNELTDELQKELCNRLGLLTGKPEANSLHIHPLINYNADVDQNINVITTDKGRRPAEDIFKNQATRLDGARGGWHTDIGYEMCPADYTILKLTKMPTTGGDTLFASSAEIYDKISPTYREFLETLTATFYQHRYKETAASKGIDLYTDARGAPENTGDVLSTTHPVVRTNPVTGWKSLFGVGHHIKKIDGLTRDESNRMHDWFLQMIVENHDTQCRHKWNNLYDIAIWDNRSTFHTATTDYEGLGARTGHRAVGVGERPYYDPASLTRREALDKEKEEAGESLHGKDGAAFNVLSIE